MWPERLKRILLVIGGTVVILIVGKSLADWQAARAAKGESIKLPTQLVVDKFEEVGQSVLGKAIEKESPPPQLNQIEVTKTIEAQTSEIIEIIKQLPQNQVDQIKKQIFKDFCQEVLGE